MNETNIDKTINNSFEQEMIDSGYNIFTSAYSNAIRGFQKRFKDNIGTKYFITVWHWNLYKQHPELRIKNIPNEDSYEFDLQFSMDWITINTKLWSKNLPNQYEGDVISLKEMEDFIEKVWVNYGKPYYEKIN